MARLSTVTPVASDVRAATGYQRSGRRTQQATLATTPALGLLVAVGLLMATVESRLHELVPRLAVVRPALLALIWAVGILLLRGEPWRAWRERRLDHAPLTALGTYLAIAFLTAPFGLWAVGSLTTAINLLPYLCLTLVAAVAIATVGPVRVLQLFIVCLGLLALAQIRSGTFKELGRYSVGSSLDPNDLGTLLGAALPLAVALLLRVRHVAMKGVLMVAAGLMLLAFARTGSRGGFLTLAAATLGTTLLLPGYRKFLMLGGTAAALALLVAFGPTPLRTRVTAMLAGEKDYNYTDRGGRLAIWKRGLTQAAKRPLTGVGIGNFSLAEGEQLKAEGRRGLWQAPHNALVQASAEMGLPGVVALLVLMGITLRRAWRVARHATATHVERAIFGAVLGFLVGSMLLSNAYAPTLFFLVGVVTGLPLLVMGSHQPGPALRVATASRGPGRRVPPHLRRGGR